MGANIEAPRAENPQGKLVLDLMDLEYVASSGLRVFMKLLKRDRGIVAINASDTAYAIFEVTGFTSLVDVRRAPHEMSVEGCEIIGKGGYGTVYRIDPETIVEVYLPTCTLDLVWMAQACRGSRVRCCPSCS